MLQIKASQNTITTLANAAELVRLIAQNVMGSDVSVSLNGSPMSNQAIYDLAASRFQAELNKTIPGGI